MPRFSSPFWSITYVRLHLIRSNPFFCQATLANVITPPKGLAFRDSWSIQKIAGKFRGCFISAAGLQRCLRAGAVEVDIKKINMTTWWNIYIYRYTYTVAWRCMQTVERDWTYLHPICSSVAKFSSPCFVARSACRLHDQTGCLASWVCSEPEWLPGAWTLQVKEGSWWVLNNFKLVWSFVSRQNSMELVGRGRKRCIDYIDCSKLPKCWTMAMAL